MKLKQFTEYMLTHRIQAVLLLAAFSLIPAVGMLGMVYAGLVTLRRGPFEGAMMTIVATLPIVIVLLIKNPDVSASSIVLWSALGFMVICNVLTWLFAVLLSRQMTWSSILQVAALVGVLVISVLHIAYPNIADWWAVQLTKASEQAASVMSGVMQDSAAQNAQLENIKEMKNYVDGIIVMLLLLNAVLQLIVARWWEAVLYAPGMLRRELHHIRLSPLAGGLFILSQIVVIYGKNGVILDILPVIYMLFAGAGLSVIQYFFGLMTSPIRYFWILLMYVMLFYQPFFLTLIGIIGLMDIWLDLRRRLRKI